MANATGRFDLHDRAATLTAPGEPWVTRKAAIDVAAFRADRARGHEPPRNSNAGAKPFAGGLRCRVLILQPRYHRADEGIDYPIRDRRRVMRCLGLPLADRVPDAKTALPSPTPSGATSPRPDR